MWVLLLVSTLLSDLWALVAFNPTSEDVQFIPTEVHNTRTGRYKLASTKPLHSERTELQVRSLFPDASVLRMLLIISIVISYLPSNICLRKHASRLYGLTKGFAYIFTGEQRLLFWHVKMSCLSYVTFCEYPDPFLEVEQCVLSVYVVPHDICSKVSCVFLFKYRAAKPALNFGRFTEVVYLFFSIQSAFFH